MLKLTFFSVGDLPKGAWQEIGAHYKKLLKKFVVLDHRVLKSEDGILEKIPKGDVVVVLDEAGKLMTSVKLAQAVRQVEDYGKHVSVVLGGAKGLSNEIKKRADLRLSFSPMTTTHDLAHLFFLEQLYRAMTIAHGKEYHY